MRHPALDDDAEGIHRLALHEDGGAGRVGGQFRESGQPCPDRVGQTGAEPSAGQRRVERR